MAKLKSVLTFMLAGAFLGNLVATFVAPGFMEWYNSSSLATQTMCNLPEVIQKVTSQFIQAQFIGSGIGAVIFLVLGIVFVQARAKKQSAPPPPASTPPPPASTPAEG
jgi:glycerol uptake facilitator-like aquaporin